MSGRPRPKIRKARSKENENTDIIRSENVSKLETSFKRIESPKIMSRAPSKVHAP
jgi:hypothetical protein